MNETKARDLGEICGDIERHCEQAERSSVPANAETLLRLLLEAAKQLPTIAKAAEVAVDAAQVAEAAAIAARDAAQAAAAAAKAQAKAPAKTTTKKAA